MTFPENDDREGGPPSKRLKLDEAVKAIEPTSVEEKSLLSFCDDILLEIFSKLRPLELFALSK